MKTNTQMIHPYTPRNREDCKQTTRICEKARKDPLQASEGTWPCQSLDFRLLTSTTHACFLMHPACGPEGSLGKLTRGRVEMEVRVGNLIQGWGRLFMLASAKNTSLNWEWILSPSVLKEHRLWTWVWILSFSCVILFPCLNGCENSLSYGCCED